MRAKEIFKITWLPVVAASLCCLSPVILVLFGLSSVTFAASLGTVFYGEYRWWFRILGFLLLVASIVLYLRKNKGICTLDQAKRRRSEIINIVAITLAVGAVAYVVWLYVVVEYTGKLLRIWE